MAEKKMSRVYNFGEKSQEFVDGQNMPVWQSPKYQSSRDAAVKLLESKEFGEVLTESDFWIQMNKTRSGKMAYTGLIISHDALLKVNSVLPEELRFNEQYCSDPQSFHYGGKEVLVMMYRDKRDGMYEVGEITPENCKNGYPFAMLSKRLFDRVVKRKANLIGIYSDSESDDFAEVSFVDTDTGEIIPKVAQAPAIKESAKPSKDTGLEDALSHVFDAGTKWKGKNVGELVTSERPSDEKMKVLGMYASRGSDNDKRACQIALAAIEKGIISFGNDVDIAS